MESLKFVMTSTFYPPYHLGGDAVHVYQLSNELAKLGHEVHIIHSIDSYRWQRKNEPIHKYSNHDNINIHSIKSPIGKLSPLISYVFGSPYPVTNKIKNIIHELKPDVVHHHNIAGLGPFILGIKAPRVLYTAHDYWLVCPMGGLIKHNKTYCSLKSNCFMCSVEFNRPPQIWRKTGILNKYIKNIDTIITPSNFMRNKLYEYGINGNFKTIYNFVSEPLKTDVPLYDYPYFLFVGTLEEHKGILNLIDVFMENKSEIDTKLLVVGTGSLESKIKKLIAKNMCENIVLLGRIDDLKLTNLYKNALAVIIPSIWPENCPLVALEALANGTYIIVSDQGGLPEIASKSSSSLVTKMDPISLKLALNKVLENRTVQGQKNGMSNNFYSKERYLEEYFHCIE